MVRKKASVSLPPHTAYGTFCSSHRPNRSEHEHGSIACYHRSPHDSISLHLSLIHGQDSLRHSFENPSLLSSTPAKLFRRPSAAFAWPCQASPSGEMLLPKGGVTWKSAKARIPPYRVIRHQFTRLRILYLLIIAVVVVLLWRGISTSSREMQKQVIPRRHLHCRTDRAITVD